MQFYHEFVNFQIVHYLPNISTVIAIGLSSNHLWIFKLWVLRQIFPHSCYLIICELSIEMLFSESFQIHHNHLIICEFFKLCVFRQIFLSYPNSSSQLHLYASSSYAVLKKRMLHLNNHILCICMDPLQCQHVGEFSSVLLLWMSSRTLYKDVASLQCGWANVGQGLIIGLWSSRTICIDLVFLRNVFWCDL